MQNVRYTAAEKRRRAAAAEAARIADERRVAALTVEEYLAEVASEFGRTHNSDVANGEDREFFVERHAALVARYA